MKKLIAISMMIALVAGAAFAQEVSLGFTVETRMSVSGESSEGNKPAMGGSVADAYLQASAANDEGTMGGLVRITQTGAAHRAFVWWKPIDQLRVFLGRDNDGMYTTAHMQAGWGFHRAGQGFFNQHSWDYWRTMFPGNWDSFGLALEITPIEGLAINFVLPLDGVTANYNVAQESGSWTNRAKTFEERFNDIRINVSYEIPSIGKVIFNYIGSGLPATFSGTENPTGVKPILYHDGTIGAAFELSAVTGLDLIAGFGMQLANRSEKNSPLVIGIAGSYAITDEFTVKFRGAFEAGGILPMNNSAAGYVNTSTANPWAWHNQNSQAYTKGNAFQFNVMPIYNLGFMEVLLDVGIRMVMPDAAAIAGWKVADLGWFINPSFRVPIPGGRFHFGFMANSAETTTTRYADTAAFYTAGVASVIQWSIPVGLVFSF